MTIFEINKLQIACFMFKVYTQQLPSYFNDLLIQNSALHSHNTKQSFDCHISLTVVLKLDSLVLLFMDPKFGIVWMKIWKVQ